MTEFDVTALNEHESEFQVQEKKSNWIAKLTEIATGITAFIGIFSFFASVMLKYSCYGRYLHFDFDLDYFDGAITNTLMLLVIYFILASVIGAIIGTLLHVASTFLLKALKPIKSKVLKNVIFTVVTLVSVVIPLFPITYFTKIFIPNNLLAVPISLLSYMVCLLMQGLLSAYYPRVKFKDLVVIIILTSVCMLSVATILLMRMGYDDAVNQKEFPIIVDNGQTFVVISQSPERYSAYKCYIEVSSNTLNILTDKQRYFDPQVTGVTSVTFDIINKLQYTPISCSDFYVYYKDEIDLIMP